MYLHSVMKIRTCIAIPIFFYNIMQLMKNIYTCIFVKFILLSASDILGWCLGPILGIPSFWHKECKTGVYLLIKLSQMCRFI